MNDHRFPKRERLKNRKDIDKLFRKGTAVYKYPVRCVYSICGSQEEKNEFPVKVAFAVPKRKIKQAVKRNLIKRRMREAYRLNRGKYLEIATLKNENKALHLVFIFQHHEILDYAQIEKGMVKLISGFRIS